MKNSSNISHYRKNIGVYQNKLPKIKARTKPVISSELLILLSKLQSSMPTRKSSQQMTPTRALRAKMKVRPSSSRNNPGTITTCFVLLLLLNYAGTANAQLNQTSIPLPSYESINAQVMLPLHIELLMQKSNPAELDKLIGDNCPPDQTISSILSNRFVSDTGTKSVAFFGNLFKKARAKEDRWVRFYIETVLCSDIKIIINDCEIVSVTNELAKDGEYLPLSHTIEFHDCRKYKSKTHADIYATVKHEAWHAWQAIKKKPRGYKQQAIMTSAPYNTDNPTEKASYRAAMAADRKNLSIMIKEAEALTLTEYSPQLAKVNMLFELNKAIYERDKTLLNFLIQTKQRITSIIDTYTSKNKLTFKTEYEMRYTFAKETINNFLDAHITAENFKKLSKPSVTNLHKLDDLVAEGIRRCEQYLDLNEKTSLSENERNILTEIEYSLIKPLPADQIDGLKAFYYKIRKQKLKPEKDRAVMTNLKNLIEKTYYNLQVLKESCSQLHISTILDYELETNILETDTTMFPILFPNIFAFHFKDLASNSSVESACFPTL